MPLVPEKSLLWRAVTLFDGLQTLPQPMAVMVADGRVSLMVPMDGFDEALAIGAVEAGSGGVMTPGLIDCHTHLVYAGERAGEFEQRLEGVAYAEIAKAGGGILSSVRATRAASEEQLLAQSLPRLQALLADGVTSVEIKSGYGLSVADELKMLRVARRLGELLPVRVITTLLAAHALPAEFADDSDGYIELVCNEIIPAAAAEGLADAVDVFCEHIGFSPAQCERVFQACRSRRTPSNSPTRVQVPSRRATAACRPTISSFSTRLACKPWRPPARSPPCCPGPFIPCAKPSCRQSHCCANTACPWPWPATPTPAPHLSVSQP